MKTQTAASPAGNAQRQETRKFLTFHLGAEQYGVGILQVHEIIGRLPVTRVPNTRPHIRGLMNLRGKILPVVDLRQWLGMEPPDPEPGTESCVIFVQVREIQMGLLVDRVSEVLEIPASQIDDRRSLAGDHLLGIANVDGSAKLLLDLEPICVRA